MQLEGNSVRLGYRKGDTELKELQYGVGEVFEKRLFVGSISLDVRVESLVLDKSHIRGQHHNGLCCLVFVLLGTLPAPPAPLLLEQESVVVVCHDSGREGPRTLKAGAIAMASAYDGQGG